MIAVKPLVHPKAVFTQRKRSGALTIAIGLRCQDGIVLCADREMANVDYTYYEPKIAAIPLSKGCVLLAQSAVDADDMKRVYEQLSSKVSNSAKSANDIREDLQTVLTTLIGSKKEIRHQALTALCPASGFDGGGAGLGHNQATLEGNVDLGSERIVWKSVNNKISPMLQPWSVIGFGESALTHYLMATLLKHGAAFSVVQAEIYALYVVRQAKKYIPGIGGSGPIDVVSLTTDGVAVVVHSLFVEAMERQLDDFEYQASVLLWKLIDKRLAADEISKSIEHFSAFLKDAHSRFKMM